MRKFDDYGLQLCKFQGNLFSSSKTDLPCSSAVFLRRFMFSSTAERMDSDGFLFGSESREDIFYDLECQYGSTDYGKVKYGSEELYWIGFLYRYWCYTRMCSSKSVYRIIKPSELRKLYFSYHSLDPDTAINRIMEAKDIKERDYTAEGVQILRRLMNNRPAADH